MRNIRWSGIVIALALLVTALVFLPAGTAKADSVGTASFVLPAAPYIPDFDTKLLVISSKVGTVQDDSKQRWPVSAVDMTTGAGKFGPALFFNGKSSTLDVPGFRISDFSSSFTIDFWIKPQTSKPSLPMIVFWDGLIPPKQTIANFNYVRLFGMITTAGKFGFRIYNYHGNPEVYSGSVIPADKWTHITVMAKRGGYLRLYVNGVLEDARNDRVDWGPFGNLKIGTPIAGNLAFSGGLDQIRISNTERLPLPAVEVLAPFMAPREAAKKQAEEALERYRKFIGPGDVISAKNYSAAEGCKVDDDGNLVMENPGAYAVYKVFSPVEGHYNVMLRTLAAKGEGEKLVRVQVTTITAEKRDFASTSSAYLRKYDDNRWHWHELNGQYSFWLTKGWSDLRVTFKSREEGKTCPVKIDAVSLNTANSDILSDLMYFRTSAQAREATKRLQSLPFRMVEVQYPFYYERKLKGKAAKERTLGLIKDSIDRELVPNGFNWISLAVYANFPRYGGAGYQVCYPSKISYLNPLITDEEDCIGEIISYAHSQGIKVAFYTPNAAGFHALPRETGVSIPQLELMVAKELIDKYHPDGLAYEGITSWNIWKDLKKIDPSITLFAYVSHTDPFVLEADSQGAWNCITMDNIDYPEEVFPPIECLYVTHEPAMNHIEFRRFLTRTLMAPKLRGIYLYFVSPYTDMQPYCAMIGDLYRGKYTSYGVPSEWK